MEASERQQRADRLLTPKPTTHFERFAFNMLHLEVKSIGPDYYQGRDKEDFDAWVTRLAWPFAYGLIQLLRIPAQRNDPQKGLFDAGAAMRSDEINQVTTALRITIPSFHKIRTMYVGAHRDEEKFTGGRPLVEAKRTQQDPRITPYGRWLRPTSLDELPQVLDIKDRQISWVGPRLPSKSDWQMIYRFWDVELDADRWIYHVQNGLKFALTGPYGVVPDNRLSMPLLERLRYDADYGVCANVYADARYVFQTPGVIFRGKGAR